MSEAAKMLGSNNGPFGKYNPENSFYKFEKKISGCQQCAHKY